MALDGWGESELWTVDNTGLPALEGYVIRVHIDTATLVTAGKMQADCDDMRFTEDDGDTLLPHWIESGQNTDSTIVYVRVPDLPADSKVNIYFYYDNVDASNEEDGEAVFSFFDHFDPFYIEESDFSSDVDGYIKAGEHLLIYQDAGPVVGESDVLVLEASGGDAGGSFGKTSVADLYPVPTSDTPYELTISFDYCADVDCGVQVLELWYLKIVTGGDDLYWVFPFINDGAWHPASAQRDITTENWYLGGRQAIDFKFDFMRSDGYGNYVADYLLDGKKIHIKDFKVWYSGVDRARWAMSQGNPPIYDSAVILEGISGQPSKQDIIYGQGTPPVVSEIAARIKEGGSESYNNAVIFGGSPFALTGHSQSRIYYNSYSPSMYTSFTPPKPPADEQCFYHVFSVVCRQGQHRFYLDHEQIVEHLGPQSYGGNAWFKAGGVTDHDLYIDWVFIRPYNDPEPFITGDSVSETHADQTEYAFAKLQPMAMRVEGKRAAPLLTHLYTGHPPWNQRPTSVHVLLNTGIAIRPPINLRVHGNDAPQKVGFAQPKLSAEHDSGAVLEAGRAHYYQLQVASDIDFSSVIWDSGAVALLPPVYEGERWEVAYPTELDLDGAKYYFRWQFQDYAENWGGWSQSEFAMLLAVDYITEVGPGVLVGLSRLAGHGGENLDPGYWSLVGMSRVAGYGAANRVSGEWTLTGIAYAKV